MLFYIAGLQNVPRDTVEAAMIDGANAWQRLLFVILPALAPTTAFVTVIALIQLLTSVDHVIVRDCPHVHEPVDGYQQGRYGEPPDDGAIGERRAQRGQLAPSREPREHEHARPHHAVRDDLDGGNPLQQVKIQGEQSPDRECGGRRGETLAGRSDHQRCFIGTFPSMV